MFFLTFYKLITYRMRACRVLLLAHAATAVSAKPWPNELAMLTTQNLYHLVVGAPKSLLSEVVSHDNAGFVLK